MVGRQSNYFFNTGIQSCINNILCTMDIGLDCFRRVVFAGRYLLQSCSMDDIIYTFKCSGQALFVSDITNEDRNQGT